MLFYTFIIKKLHYQNLFSRILVWSCINYGLGYNRPTQLGFNCTIWRGCRFTL